MANCIVVDNRGDLNLDPASIDTCTGFVVLEPFEYFNTYQAMDLALLDITPENILFVLTWGMGVVLFMWSLGYAIGAAVKLIKKV